MRHNLSDNILTASFSSNGIALFALKNFGVIGWIEFTLEFHSINRVVTLSYFRDGKICTVVTQCYTIQNVLIVMQDIWHSTIIAITPEPVRIFVHLQAPGLDLFDKLIFQKQ